MTMKTSMNKKKKRLYKLIISQLHFDKMPEVADHLAHIMEMECDECKPSKGTNTLYDMFSEDVDKGHAYLTEPKVILVDPAIEIDKRKKPAPAKKKPEKKPVTPKKTTPKAPETPTQVTRSGRAVKANRRFIDDMETGSSDEEEPVVRNIPPAIAEDEDSEEEEGDEEEDTDGPAKRGRGRATKKQSAGSKKDGRKESPEEVVIGSITVMEGNTLKGRKGARKQSGEDASEERRSTRGKIKENEESKKRTTRGSSTKKEIEDPAEMYRVKGKPQIIRKGKAPEKETPNSRKRTHSQVEEEKSSSAATKKSKVSDAVDRITKKGEAKEMNEKDEDKEEKDDREEDEEEEEEEEEKESRKPISKKSIEKIDPYSPDFSVKNFATWIREGKKGKKGWKKAVDSPKSSEKKSPGRGWIKITNSDSNKDEQEEIPEEDYVEEEIVVPTFKCDQCGAEFKKKENLQEHKRVKHKVPLTCEHCGNRFVSKQSLASHMLTHTGGSDKPYSCGVCGARFTQKSHIGPHMLTHTGEKTFTCQYCFTKFRQKSAMTEHIKRMHPADTDGPKPHICKLCPIGFWSSGALQHHMKVAHSGDKSGASSPSRPKSPPKKEIVYPPPAHPEPVNLFIGVYECSLCAEKFEEMMDLAEHVKTHMTPLEEEEELKNAQIAEAARAQAIEREEMLLWELEEANRRVAEREAAGEVESKDQLDISDIINRPKGVPIKIPPGITDIKTSSFRGYSTPKAATSTKVPLENVVISTPSGLKFTIKASPQLKGSKYKLAALPLKGLSGLGQHLKSGVLKLAPTPGSSKYGLKSSSQQIKMKILGGEGDGSVIMSSTNPQDSSMQGTVLDLKDITKTAADISGVPGQPAEDVLNMQPKLEPPPPPPQPAQPTDQTYYQCGDCSALFETMEAIQAHLQNDCNAAANQAAAAAQASAAAAANVAAVPTDTMVDNLGSIPSVDASEMTGTTTIDLGQPVVPGTSLITENGAVIPGANIGEIATDPTSTVPISSIAFDAGLQVMATAAGMTSLAPTTLEDPNQAVATPDDSELTPEQTGTDSAAMDSEHSEHASVVEPGVSDSPVLSMEDPETAGGGSVNEANSEIAVSEASAELAQDTEPAAGDAEATEETAPMEENAAADEEAGEAPLEVNQDGSEEQPMETNETEPSAEEMLTMPEAEDGAEVADPETLPATSGENIVVTQMLNIPGMDTTQSVMQSIPATTAAYEGRKMISILNQPGVVQTPNGEGDALVTQGSGVIGEGSNGNFENVVLGQGEEDNIAQPQEQGEQLTLVDQTQAVTLPDGQQIVTYIDEGGQLPGNGNQQFQVVTTESGETYQIALPEGGVQGPMQYVTEDGQILTFKGSDLANQGEYMVVDNGNLGGVPVTQTSDNVQYVVYTSSS